MIDNTDTPFGEIINQLPYGMKVYTVTIKRLIPWLDDKLTVYWVSLTIELDSIHLFIFNQLGEKIYLMKSRLHVTSEMITGIEDCMPSLYDDMSNADNSYYFLNDS